MTQAGVTCWKAQRGQGYAYLLRTKAAESIYNGIQSLCKMSEATLLSKRMFEREMWDGRRDRCTEIAFKLGPFGDLPRFGSDDVAGVLFAVVFPIGRLDYFFSWPTAEENDKRMQGQ